MDERPRWRMLFGILAGALLLRGATACAVQTSLPPGQICLIAGDAEGYWELARRITVGADYAIYQKPRYALRMPGFPLLLAGVIRVCGVNPLAARLVLAVIGTAACAMVYWLGRELLGPVAGLWACLYCAVSPTMVLFSVLILSETLFALMLVASLIALVKLWSALRPAPVSCNKPGASQASDSVVSSTSTGSLTFGGMVGILIGAATMVRPTWLLIGPAATVLTVLWGRYKPSAWLAAMGVLLGLSLCLAPWTIRNRGVTGHYVPTTLWVGPSLYDGLSPQADGSSRMEFVERDGVYDRLTEYEADQYYRAKAWEFVRSEPWRAVQLGMLKLGRYFSPWPNAAQFQSPLLSSGLVAQFLLLLGTACLGAWTLIRSERGQSATLGSDSRSAVTGIQRAMPSSIVLIATAGPLLYFAAIHTVFVGSLRYRLPAEYPLSVLSAVGVVAIGNRLRNTRQVVTN